MFYSSINTDFAAYQTKVAFGLTKRQIICFLTAAVIGLPVYYFTKDHIGTDMADILMIIIMAPLFVLAMYKKNGQNLARSLYYPSVSPELSPQAYIPRIRQKAARHSSPPRLFHTR